MWVLNDGRGDGPLCNAHEYGDEIVLKMGQDRTFHVMGWDGMDECVR